MATSFTFESVADNIPIAGLVSLALDRSGNPSIVFSERSAGQVILARRNAGSWTLENVTGAFIGPARARLAIDSNGNPQVAYRDMTTSSLMHAVKSGGQWSLTSIPTRLTPGPSPSGVGTVDFALHPGRLDTESRDVGYFVYVDLPSDGIGFAHTGSLGPTPVTVQLDPNERMKFSGPSGAFDSSENFFVGYVGIFPTGAPQDSISIRESHIVDIEKGTFSTPAVIEGSQQINVRSATSIVRTGSGGCLAYYDMANRTVKASVSSGSFSSIETIATGVTANDAPSAAVNRGAFRVAFADVGGMKLASRSGSGNWTIEVVEAVGSGSPSVAYDNAGTANIAYAAGPRLRFARRSE
jgi:hypothetical protein